MIEYTVKVFDNGDKSWYLNGKRHREDGPAVEWANGDKLWCLHGKFHREDGPAVEWANGYKAWYLNDNRHRDDGPAIEEANGYKEWYLNGKESTAEDHTEQTAPAVEMTIEEICKELGKKVKVIQ